MHMRHALPASSRRGPARCPYACWVGNLRWSAAHAWGGSGPTMPKARECKPACTLLTRAPQPSPKPTRESTLLTSPGRTTSGCSDAASEQLKVVRSRRSCCSLGEGERRRLPADSRASCFPIAPSITTGDFLSSKHLACLGMCNAHARQSPNELLFSDPRTWE